MVSPFASLRVNSAKHPGIFPHCLSLQMRGFFSRRAGSRSVGQAVAFSSTNDGQSV